MHFQLPQIEQDGADNGRRFRVENGDSLGEKEEVRKSCLMIKRSSFFLDFFLLSLETRPIYAVSVIVCSPISSFILSHFFVPRMSFVTIQTIFTLTDVRLAEYADTRKSGVPNALVLQILPGQT